jgi:hypothetical protein
VEVAVGGYLGVLEQLVVGAHARLGLANVLEQRREQMPLVARAMRLGVDDDLSAVVDDGETVVVLEYAATSTGVGCAARDANPVPLRTTWLTGRLPLPGGPVVTGGLGGGLPGAPVVTRGFGGGLPGGPVQTFWFAIKLLGASAKASGHGGRLLGAPPRTLRLG